MTKEHSVLDIKKRLSELSNDSTGYILRMNEWEREEYCDLSLAPFKGTSEQRQEIIEVLKAIAKKVQN